MRFERYGSSRRPPPDETTPQGTQSDAVEFGHEGRDINLRQVISWLLGTYRLSSGEVVLPKVEVQASTEPIKTTGQKLDVHK